MQDPLRCKEFKPLLLLSNSLWPLLVFSKLTFFFFFLKFSIFSFGGVRDLDALFPYSLIPHALKCWKPPVSLFSIKGNKEKVEPFVKKRQKKKFVDCTITLLEDRI